MSNIAKKIAKRIEKEGIKIIPRWRFLLTRSFIWVSLCVAVALSAVAVSMIMFQIIDIEWDMLPKMGGPKRFFAFVGLVPYFWLIVATLLFVFVYFDFRRTRRGHRYSGGAVVIGSVVISIVIGVCMYFVHTPRFANEVLRDVPPFRQMENMRKGFWHEPTHGMISGVILSVESNKIIIVEDFIEHIWNVDVEFAEVKGQGFVPGRLVRIIGDFVDKDDFVAKEVRCK